MSKKTLKIITIIATIVAVVCISSICFAEEGPLVFKNTNPSSDFNSVGETIIGALKGIGTIVAVAILIVIGIKYMMGSAEEKAEYKKVMIPYLIGAVLIFAAPYIAGAIYTFSQNNFK